VAGFFSAGFLTTVFGATGAAFAGVATDPFLAARLCMIISIFLETDRCLFSLFLSLDFGRVVLCVVTPCCLLACALVIFNFI